MKENEEKTCQVCHVLVCSGGSSKWTETLGPSPSLAIYSHYHHTYLMCISTVHYCCHRNVMHSVSYRLTQLNGKPCLICSGSFIFILYWKGVCKYSGKGRWKEGRRERMKDDERQQEAGSSPLLLFLFASPRVPPSRLPLFSLMSVLSGGSQCESVTIIYTHAVTLYYTHVAISSLILCAVCLYHGSIW